MTRKEYAVKSMEDLVQLLKEGDMDKFVGYMNQVVEALYNDQSDDAASKIIFKKPIDKEKLSEPLHKTYRDLAYGAMLEAARCNMLIRKLTITRELMNAEEAYFDAMSELEQENDSTFGFDLSI